LLQLKLQEDRKMATNDESLLRSASMSLCQFYIPQELAHATVEELGGAPTVVYRMPEADEEAHIGISVYQHSD
jgi:hypothetical protein